MFDDGNVECGATSESESDKQKDQSTREMRSIVPGSGDVRKFSESGKNHDDGSDSASEGDRTPCHRCGSTLRRVDPWCVVSGVKEVHGHMNDPYPIKVNEEMAE